jgi:poly-gamma-glutamate synthesis protein (capsule biosynthesis protein)
MAGQQASDTGSLPLRSCVEISGINIRALPSRGVSSGEVAFEGIFEGRELWHTKPKSIVSLEVAKLDGMNDLILTLERHYSNMDRENGLRPYVYSVARNGLTARWRGSALAWPLIDAFILPGNEQLICALHRQDSFINPNPSGIGTRTAVYQWNGFGFSGVKEKTVCDECGGKILAD